MTNIATICDDLELFKISPRLGRIKCLGLVSFWAAIGMLGTLPVVVVAHEFFIIIGLIIFLAAVINIFYLKVRRLNDCNLSGWWLLLIFIPVINFFWTIAIYLVPGTKGKNKFGKQPPVTETRYYYMILSAPIALFIWTWFLVQLGNQVQVEHILLLFRS